MCSLKLGRLNICRKRSGALPAEMQGLLQHCDHVVELEPLNFVWCVDVVDGVLLQVSALSSAQSTAQWTAAEDRCGGHK